MARLRRQSKRAEGHRQDVLATRAKRVRRRCRPCVRRLHRLHGAAARGTAPDRATYLRKHRRISKRCTGRRRNR